ncbi:MAG: thiamine pyrophosphate-dependent dehydrogenase E1 component subunit alpha [Longimicrobiales bacterium]|nr:thiamine pyrophosphate-dependent dehydrogenase E1 component subunit alpha [Longimicrobiales bacterium]
MPTTPPLLDFYRAMARARAYELLLLDLWEEGLISGELHLGTGEEAVAAGLTPLLREGDALSLDHRPTPLLLLRGVDPIAMTREMLGRPDGLCGGFGGHMHLFSPDHLAASSGIVGASVPAACGLALAATRLRPGSVAIATLGDGAMNQGMVLETLNLAAVWELPLVVVCKDNDWAITTESHAVTAGSVPDRARALGVPAEAVDGTDPEAVHRVLGPRVAAARSGEGPAFVLARCPRLDGHMAGFIMDRVAGSPLAEGAALLGRVASAAVAPGGGFRKKAASLGAMTRTLKRARSDRRDSDEDPLARVADRLPAGDAQRVMAEAAEEMERVREAALARSEVDA